ncbi:hypothetical protein GCM10010123_30100 [Pilimelia anulata]|uniref:Uncharacterized protein n=1 Tax=Pilimelia anulata TaxID=53371 RepID=A0A8J3B626_9ACTN|nr:hypothetical protein [Pilimelia anulata]GGJ98019.1 hypothetical protein GCM10010123_30100 [Pilimelia anulata]
MFVQLIIGRVADADALRSALARWRTDLAPGATGWLGTTAGLTDDGTFVCLARFSSPAAARQSSDRVDQHQWWMSTAKTLHAEPAFHDCDRPLTLLGGASERAGFVQVVEGRTAAPERLRELLDHTSEQLGALRPDLIGGVVTVTDDGTVHRVNYFTSEVDARLGERKPEPPGLRAQRARHDELVSTDRYLDLTDPWHLAPALT